MTIEIGTEAIWVLLALVSLLLPLVQVLIRFLRREDALLFEHLGRPDLWRWLYEPTQPRSIKEVQNNRLEHSVSDAHLCLFDPRSCREQLVGISKVLSIKATQQQLRDSTTTDIFDCLGK